MAIIHNGRNKLREELDSYYAEACRRDREIFDMVQQEDRLEHENRCAAYRKAIPTRILLILLSLALFLLLALWPEPICRLQEVVHTFFTGLGDALGDFMTAKMTAEPGGIGEILLHLLLSVLSLIAAVLLWVLKLLSWPIALAVCIALPALMAFFSVRGLVNKPWPFAESVYDEQARRDRIMNGSLPSEMKILKAGLEGEEDALKLLSSLGNDCHIYTNLLIPHDGKVSETDIIVVAPHAVTIVEVKNYRDELSGDWSDEQLVLEAERGRSVHRHEVYNPVRQVSTHARRLQGFLADNDINVQVKKCVLFINSDIYLYGMTDRNGVLQDCPVFCRYQIASLITWLQTSLGASPPRAFSRLLSEMAVEQAAGNIPHADPVSLDSFDGILYNDEQEAYVTMPLNSFENEDENENENEDKVYYSPYPIISDDTGE